MLLSFQTGQIGQSKDSKNGVWEVTIKDLQTGDIHVEHFDAVMVCTGHHAEKKMPQFEGEKEFKGQIIHSHDYRDHRGYEDKRVVVVGIGNSGGDVAVELGKVSKQVCLMMSLHLFVDLHKLIITTNSVNFTCKMN